MRKNQKDQERKAPAHPRVLISHPGKTKKKEMNTTEKTSQKSTWGRGGRKKRKDKTEKQLGKRREEQDKRQVEKHLGKRRGEEDK